MKPLPHGVQLVGVQQQKTANKRKKKKAWSLPLPRFSPIFPLAVFYATLQLTDRSEEAIKTLLSQIRVKNLCDNTTGYSFHSSIVTELAGNNFLYLLVRFKRFRRWLKRDGLVLGLKLAAWKSFRDKREE